MTEITQVCPACGRRFAFSCHPDEWGYAYGSKLTCSYTCMRQMERKYQATKKEKVPFDNRAMLYRQHALGMSYEDIAKGGTARNNGWTDPEKIKRILLSWANHYPDRARAIRIEALFEQEGVCRADLAEELHLDAHTIGEWAHRIGIFGRKCGKRIFYTQTEADKIRQAVT